MLYYVGRAMLRLKARRVFGHWNIRVYGDFTAVNPANIRVGNDVAINHDVFLLARAGITIGDRVVLSARCMIIDAGLALGTKIPAVERDHTAAAIVIHDSVWIGAGAIILPGVTIGRNAVVGAGSVVTQDVPADSVVAGNPARVLSRGTR